MSYPQGDYPEHAAQQARRRRERNAGTYAGMRTSGDLEQEAEDRRRHGRLSDQELSDEEAYWAEAIGRTHPGGPRVLSEVWR